MVIYIQIAVSHPMYRNPDSRIQEMFAYGIRNIAQRIWNPTNKWNPESIVQVAKNMDYRIHGVESCTLTGDKVRPILTSGTPIILQVQ